MIWQDLVVQNPLSDSELTRGLAIAFDIQPQEVVINRGGIVFEENTKHKILCDVFGKDDGFRLVISIYTFFEDSHVPDDPIALVKKFVSVTQTECLLADDSPDPYTMIRILTTGEVIKATLHVNYLDDREEYHVVE